MPVWSFAEQLNADAVYEACRAATQAAAPAGLEALLRQAGAPVRELAVTPISARVSAVALGAGHDFVHHELRVELPSADHGDPAPANPGTPDPAWVDGVRELSKYAQARLEAPLATYDPNHRIKWRTHELLHRRMGFFWRPDQSPFEMYLGARLSELLPVVHWYGFDEAFRPRCDAHRGRVLFREHCRVCECLAQCYWDDRVGESDFARERIAASFDHLHAELQAVDAERADGQRRATPRGPLDASSDANAYAAAHWDRVTAWSFGSWVEIFCVPGVDYCTSIAQMRGRVDEVLAQILCEPVEIDVDRSRAQRARQRLRELGFRCLLALEREGGESQEDRYWPMLETAGAACSAALAAPAQAAAHEELARAEAQLSEALRADADPLCRVWQIGALWDDTMGNPPELSPASGAIELVRSGIVSGLPDNFSEDPSALTDAALGAFILSEAFVGPGELRARYGQHLARLAMDGPAEPAAECVALELFLRGRPHRDDAADAFAALPAAEEDDGAGQWPAGELRAHSSLRRGRFSPAAITRILGWTPPSSAELARVFVDGAARVVELDDELAGYVSALERGERPPLDDISRGLLEARIWVWFPQPR